MLRRVFFAAALACASAPELHGAVPYQHVQATAEVSTSPVSRYVSVRVHLRNIGGIATACVVKASGQTRVTGVSADGVADVSFDSLRTYKGYVVSCQVN